MTEDSPLRQSLYPYRNQSKGSDDRMYEYEKIVVEWAVLGDSEIEGTVLRLPMVYGPRDHHRTSEYLKRMDDDRLGKGACSELDSGLCSRIRAGDRGA